MKINVQTFTLEELEAAIEKLFGDKNKSWDDLREAFDLPEIGHFEIVEDGVGLVGEERNDAILVIKTGERYFKKTGSYDSWNGTEWDGPFEEVRLVEVAYTKYEPI